MAIEDIAIASTLSYLYRPTIVYRRRSRRQAIEQRRAELQQKRQEAANEKQKERLDYALKAIRDNGGSISRKQLTEILIKKFSLSRTTVTVFISNHVGDSFYEVDGMIQTTQDMLLQL
ncbi:MAG: hypothetical protein K6G92_00550 [Bacteroidaceae bacterium]|nr:hypothetical protein [Bacteroidaceae bacterium]